MDCEKAYALAALDVLGKLGCRNLAAWIRYRGKRLFEEYLDRSTDDGE